ncbi:MAG: methyltransferase family protein [Bacillota bacterium]|jgi:protein-S-isoprenylcysteine O-methyltransferase Ste14
MVETLESHFGQWGGVVFFTLLYGIALLFVPFYRQVNRKPATAYLAFVLAFAVEMHGIPMSMVAISWVIGRKLPNGILWGHTLFEHIGNAGMYVNIVLSLIALAIIANGWYHIYHQSWSKNSGEKRLVKSGVYRHIRHPQYTGFILLTLGMLCEWATLPLLLSWPLIVLMYYRLAKREERDMLLEFGEEYAAYMRKTKRFIPFVV